MKRSDLIKRFDEIVKQEIINHNRQISDTNQSIQNIRQSIADLSKTTASSLALLNSQLVSLDSSVRDMEKRAENKVYEVRKVANDSLCLSEKVASHQNHLDEKIQGVAQKREKDNEENIHISKFINNISSDVKRLDMKIGQEISYMQGRVNFAVEEIKRKSEEIPSYFCKFENDVGDALDTQRVDINCLKQDLEILKKSVHYIEKKIENLYTLIERMTKRISS